MDMMYNILNLDKYRLYFVLFFIVGIQVNPHLKSLHLTLAHQFDVGHKETLKSLIKSMINPSIPCLWELKLYSREATASNKPVKYSIVLVILS